MAPVYPAGLEKKIRRFPVHSGPVLPLVSPERARDLNAGGQAMKWKPLLAGTAVLAAVAGAAGFWWPFGSGPAGLNLPGTVEVQEVRLGSKAGGRVAEVAIREGDLVKPGQLLVRLEEPELEAQRQQ